MVRLELVGLSSPSKWKAAFFLFRGFSPFVKSLRVNNAAFPPSPLFDLILSFPLLEDLLIIDCYCTSDNGSDSNEASTHIQPSGPPMFTGSFVLFLDGGAWPIVHRLLSLPIRFRELTLAWFRKEDISPTMALVEKCSHTLESPDIACYSSCGTPIKLLRSRGIDLLLFPVDPMSVPFDLSKAMKLGYAVFRPESLRVGRITHVLRVITSEHRELRRISVDVPHTLAAIRVSGAVWNAAGEEISEQWLGLDRILVHLWESFSIRVNVRLVGGWEEGIIADYVEGLLPGMIRRGMVTADPVQ